MRNRFKNKEEEMDEYWRFFLYQLIKTQSFKMGSDGFPYSLLNCLLLTYFKISSPLVNNIVLGAWLENEGS